MVPLPKFVQMEPVGQCNLRCQMCPIQFRRDGPPWGPPAFMNYELYTSLVDQFSGVKDLHLQGLGEPMMHPRFFEMVEYAVGKGMTVSINSNFTLLTPEKAERLVTSGLDTLHVSIDGATRETYERIRVFARFKVLLRNVEWLLKAKHKLKSDHPKLRLVMVAMRQNLPEIPQIVELAHRLEIRSIFVQHLAHDFQESSLPAHYKPMREFVEAQTLLNEDMDLIQRYFSQARETAQRYDIDLRLPEPRVHPHAPGTSGRDRCDWPWRGAYISYQGLAMPCCMVATPDRINFGSFAEQDVQTLWNNEAYTAFRNALADDPAPEICKSCSLYSGTF
jgi:radical SAM protein with 4Fe4S-binding SPASM domain